MSDLIRREDLFELMMRHKPLDNGDGSKERYAYIEWLGIYHAIRELPSADRPQGEWIVSCKDSICSVCGKDEAEFICGTEDWYGYGLSNYCPNCGARMKGADDETD